MVSSVGGTPSLQQTVPQPSGNNASVGAVKRSLDVEKMAGQAIVDMINESSLHKGNSIDIQA